jgi:hypothetical protein
MFLSLLSRLSLAFFFFFFLCLGFWLSYPCSRPADNRPVLLTAGPITIHFVFSATSCGCCCSKWAIKRPEKAEESYRMHKQGTTLATCWQRLQLREISCLVDPIFKQASLLLLPWVASSHQSWDCGWDDDKARVHKESSGLVSAERHRQSGERYFPTLLCINLINPQRITDFFVLQSLMMRVVHKPHKPQRMIDFFVLQSLMMMRVA